MRDPRGVYTLSAEPPPSDLEATERDGVLRVLLVEDNEADQWFFTEILRSRGYAVVACDSGEAAIEILESGIPELVLLDLMLPGVDGVEVCRRVRAAPAEHAPFIIVVTALDGEDALEEVLSAGADDFVRKPVEASDLAIRLGIAERRLRENRELRAAERELASATWELDTLFNNVQDVFFSVDVTNERIIQISPAAKIVFGHEPGELTGKDEAWRRFLLPAEDARNPWEELLAESTGGPFVREYGVRHADGSERWVRARVQVRQDDGYVRANGVVVDISHERGARAELAQRNRELAVLYRLAELTLSATSLDEAYTQILDLVSAAMGCSVVAIEHLDRDRDRLVMTAAKGIPALSNGPISIPLHKTLSGLAVSTGAPVLESDPSSRREHAHEVLRKLNLRSYASFPLISGGTVFGTLTLCDTEPVALDERFERLGSNLATTVSAYVERLEAEEAMRDSEMRHRVLATQLQQANQELESFAYSVSHDLRAPLRTMQGFAHALLYDYGDQLSAEARDYANRIIASGRQSEKLISDLLAYSRLSFERLELMPVDLQAVVASAREQVAGDLEASEAVLVVEEPLPSVSGNLTALVQVVANLLSNAVKFVSDDRQPEVRIRAEERDTRIRLWVEDNGIGVPEGQEDRIFRVFERLSEGADHPGTGIGLAIVRRGLQRIGGDCGVEQLPKGGSGFWIDVPKHHDAAWRPAWRGPGA